MMIARMYAVLSLLLVVWLTTPGVVTASPMALFGSGRVDFYPNSWSEGAVRWVNQQAGQGSILILTCQDQTDDLARYFEWQGAEKASYLVIPERYAADHPQVYTRISAAAGLVLVDGQKQEMIEKWRGTRTESAIRDHVAAGRVLAGFGSGAEVLAALIPGYGTTTPAPLSFLQKPVNPTETTADFCPFLPDAIVHTGFFRRGLLPQALSELSRSFGTGSASALVVIGIDEHTALVTDTGRELVVLGEGSVAIFSRTASSGVRIDPRLPPVMTHIGADLLTEGFVYDLVDRVVIAAPPSAVTVATPGFVAPPAAVFLSGDKDASERAGPVALTNLYHEYLALQHGLLRLIKGDSLLPQALVIANGLTDAYVYENQIGGILWGLANNPGFTGLVLSPHTKIEILTDGTHTPQAVSDQAAALVFDTRWVSWRDFSRWISHPEGVGKRQSVALIGLRIHQIASRRCYHAADGSITELP
jgi:cyanophycinase-like exopeptidase